MSELLTERWGELAFAKDSTTVITEKKKDPYEKCWDGYERVPGTKKGEKGSCRKKGSANEADEVMSEVEEIQEISRKVKDLIQEKKQKGLWDNIHAKRKRGEKPAKPGEKGYPSKKSWEETTNEADELMETDETDEGNAFSGARQEAIDNDEDEFEVDGEKYEVTGDKTKTMSESQLRRVIRKAILEACYQGKKVKLNSPSSNSENPKKKSKVYVSTGERIKGEGPCKGEVKAKKVQFGDPNMRIRKSNPKARSNFRKRHKCHEKKPKDSAGYWSCKAW
tara:strand:- start:8882 stop:9718 length:837 start_codon:yes stop_codon:yes gene_type:complete